MNPQQFDNTEPPRAQRMTEQEAQAVIALWQQERVEQGGLTNKPALPDVAEGLDISVEDVRRLLDQVRTQRVAEEKLLAWEQAEAELEQIRLAEEERKLAEVRRQRAELQRQHAEAERERAEPWSMPQWETAQQIRSNVRASSPMDGFGWVFGVLIVVTLALWALSTAIHSHLDNAWPAAQTCNINNKPAPAGDCYAIEHGYWSPSSRTEYNNDAKR